MVDVPKKLKIHPLPEPGLLPLNVLFITVNVPPSVKIMLPFKALLPLNVLFVIVNVPPLYIPPPVAALFPPDTVISCIVAVTPAFTLNTLDALFPLTVIRPAPGPEIVMSLSMTSSPDVRVIAPVMPGIKSIVPPGQMSAIACLSVPEPLSLMFDTVMELPVQTMNVALGPAAGAVLPAVSEAVPAAMLIPRVPDPVIPLMVKVNVVPDPLRKRDQASAVPVLFRVICTTDSVLLLKFWSLYVTV